MRFNQLLPPLKLLNGSFVVILPKGTSDVVVSERSVQEGSLCPTTKAFEGFRFAAACPALGMGRAGSLTSPGGGGLRGGGRVGTCAGALSQALTKGTRLVQGTL